MTDTNGTVKSAPAYLHGLVKRANDGTFEPVGAVTAKRAKVRICAKMGNSNHAHARKTYNS